MLLLRLVILLIPMISDNTYVHYLFYCPNFISNLPLVPSPTGPHPARGDSGVCLEWSVFPTAFIVSLHLINVLQVLHLPVQSIYNPSGRRRQIRSKQISRDKIRTLDPQVRSLTLYQLCYVTLDRRAGMTC